MHHRPYDSIEDMIGWTPLVRLKSFSEQSGSDVFAKLEYMNPGQSVKDRIVVSMIEAAERSGELAKGDVIVDASSGNTGFSLAMICAAKGYQCVVTVKHTASTDKIRMIEGQGAEVVLCDASLPGDHPDSYYNTAKRIAEERGGFYLNQNHDLGNAEAHFNTTGPELLQQTSGEITHFVACASTGGTVSGSGRYLKSQNPDIKIIGVDSCTEVLRTYHETGVFDYDGSVKSKLEGVGKNIIPKNVDFNIIDEFVNVTDCDSAHAALHLARTEGIMSGYSSGAVMAGFAQIIQQIPAGSTVVLLFPDHGGRYLSKIYNDDWMIEQGFMSRQEAEHHHHAFVRVNV